MKLLLSFSTCVFSILDVQKNYQSFALIYSKYHILQIAEKERGGRKEMLNA